MALLGAFSGHCESLRRFVDICCKEYVDTREAQFGRVSALPGLTEEGLPRYGGRRVEFNVRMDL